MLRFAVLTGLLLALTLDHAAAQEPTQAQRDAIRASCRSDFMANCSGVQPGGKEALDCLRRNDPKLSASCKAAVSAVAPKPAEPTSPAAAAPAAPKPEAAPSPAQAPASPPAAPAQQAAPAKKPAEPARASRPAPAAAAPAVAPIGPVPMMLPREALAILQICRVDAQALCTGVPEGGGRVLNCLAQHAPTLSPQCYGALSAAARR